MTISREFGFYPAVRDIAEFQMSVVSDSKNRLLDEHVAAFRWLIASLFAANGGALVALAGSENVAGLAKLWACGLFTLGVLLSLLVARLNQQNIKNTIEPLAELVGFWGCVARGMEFDEEQFKKLGEATQKHANKAWPTQLAGWGAAATFLLGMCAAGVGYWDDYQHEDQVKIASSRE